MKLMISSNSIPQISIYDRRRWLAEYLRVEPYYASEFSRKILRGFIESGTISPKLLNYVSVCAGYHENEIIREFVKNLGISCRHYWCSDCFEYLLKKNDYHLFCVSASQEIHREENYKDDIHIDKLYESYKQHNKKHFAFLDTFKEPSNQLELF